MLGTKNERLTLKNIIINTLAIILATLLFPLVLSISKITNSLHVLIKLILNNFLILLTMSTSSFFY